MRSLLSIGLILLLLGCASARPVYYPNATLEQAGSEGAQADYEDCLVLAESSGVSPSGAERAGEVAADTAGRAGAGGAAGAVGGAIRGSNVGIAAAVGAGVAATWGVVRTGFRWMFGARDLDQVERRFVERCLEDRGYDVVGWR